MIKVLLGTCLLRVDKVILFIFETLLSQVNVEPVIYDVIYPSDPSEIQSNNMNCTEFLGKVEGNVFIF